MNIRRLHRPMIPRNRRWSKLAAPVFAGDNQIIIRATSLVRSEMRDCSTMLTITEARDIVAWYERSAPQPLSWWERQIRRIKTWLCASK